MKDIFGKNAETLKNKKLYLFDMDGTVYLDETLFDGVPEMLERIEKKGGNYVFITNNSSRSVSDYVAKMHRLGLKNTTEEHFFTSAQATLELIKERHPGALVYVQATRSLIKEFTEKGVRVTTQYDPSAEVVLVGFDPEFTGQKVYNTCKMLTKHDLPYYATNPDWVCPVEFGYIPDCGAMCHSIELATGKKPYFIGKPQPTMVYAAMNKFSCPPECTVVIGDRLYTDIASGNNAGVDTVCVLSGEVTLGDVQKATGSEAPTYVFEAVSKMPI